MTHSTKILALALLAAVSLAGATGAQAGDWTNSGSYNGYGASTQNTRPAIPSGIPRET